MRVVIGKERGKLMRGGKKWRVGNDERGGDSKTVRIEEEQKGGDD